MDIKSEIVSALKNALKEFTPEEVKFSVEEPENEKFGDYSSNIALSLFSNSKFKSQNFGTPLELAEKIINLIIHDSKFMIHFEKVEAIKPGFINFHLSKKYLSDKLQEVSNRKEKYGEGGSLKGKKIMVEFAHPNTHKEFHIGHLRNIILGESICRILTINGANIKRVNYQGDVGLHVAKAIFGIKKLLASIGEAKKWSPTEKAKFLGKAYAFGSKSYEENLQNQEEIIKINKQIYSKDSAIMPLWEKTRQWSLDYFDALYKRLNTKFERFYFESEVFKSGRNTVLLHVKDGVFEKSDGAIIFDGKKYGLHKRVFVTQEGNPTYEGKEMGLGPLQYKEFNFDQALHVVGPEQAGYFEVVFKALEKLDPVFVGKEKHLSYGFVQLKEGKMSSRTGKVVSGEWLLDEAKIRIKKSFKDMDETTAEEVAVGAVKYSMLKFSRESNIQFSFEDSISLEGNSGPYLQYAFARTCSILSKTSVNNQSLKIENPIEDAEFSLLRALGRFPQVLEKASKNFAPNLLCNYLFDLAQKFNLFYQKHKIIGSDKQEFRLQITSGVGQVIKTGLNLLGIQAPEKM